jgi:hypothetical protein
MSKQQAVVLAVVVGLIVLIMVSMSALKRPSILDEQCRIRLHRLTEAVNFWLEDHGHSSFPLVVNPQPHQGWFPERAGSADSIFWKYLGGNVTPQRRDGETDSQYLERLRDGQMTLCPVSRFEFVYNDALRDVSPTALADGTVAQAWYFRCQSCADGSAPHKKSGVGGIHVGFVHGEVGTISHEEAEAVYAEVERLEKEYAKKPGKALQEKLDAQRTWAATLKREFGSSTEPVRLNRLNVGVEFEALK